MNLFVLRTWLEAEFGKDEDGGVDGGVHPPRGARYALAVIAAVVFLKNQVNSKFNDAGSKLSSWVAGERPRSTQQPGTPGCDDLVTQEFHRGDPPHHERGTHADGYGAGTCRSPTCFGSTTSLAWSSFRSTRPASIGPPRSCGGHRTTVFVGWSGVPWNGRPGTTNAWRVDLSTLTAADLGIFP